MTLLLLLNLGSSGRKCDSTVTRVQIGFVTTLSVSSHHSSSRSTSRYSEVWPAASYRLPPWHHLFFCCILVPVTRKWCRDW